MVRGLQERERLRDLFGRYLSREVSEAVLAGRVTLGGQRKTVTVLFCDMRGSTAFAEAHPPEAVMAALNQYFAVIIRATEAQGGVVSRFLGDATFCVFGAPTEYADHAERAVRAAIVMRAGLAAVSRQRAAAGQPTLTFGIGINSGEVTVGATGSELRQEYTLIGDPVNVAARIEKLNKDYPEYGIILSADTRAALGDRESHYSWVDLGALEIAGKRQPVRVLAVQREPAATPDHEEESAL
jgi:adenylate cyclase